MNEQPTSATANDEFAPDIANFVSFLNDETPPLFIAASLSALLRTEPPVRFGVARVADVVADWAADRSARSGERVSDLMLLAVRNIISAYGVNAIADFKPKEFYRPFVAGLMARCPDDERDGLQAALRDLQSGDPQRAAIRSTADYEGAQENIVRARANSRSTGFADVIARIAEQPEMPEATFEEEIAALRRVVLERGTVAVVLPIESLVELAIAVFNGDRLERAGKLFAIAADWLDHPDTPAPKRLEVRRAHRSAELDERLLVTAATDPVRSAFVRPAVRCFADLSPDAVLLRIQNEKAPGHVRFLLTVLELHGPAAHSAILNQLQTPAGGRGGEFVVSLLDVLSRIPAPTEATQRRAATVVGPLVSSRDALVRAAALRAIAHVDPQGAVPHVLKALEAPSYGKLSSADEEALLPHLLAALELLAQSKSDTTVAVVAEYATGARTGSFRLGRTLRERAAQALAQYAKPLPRRAVLVITNALEEMAGKRLKLRIGGFGLGVDRDMAAMLLDLLEGSSAPEAQSAIASPAIAKLAGR